MDDVRTLDEEELHRLVNGVLCPSVEGTTLPAWAERELARGLGGIFLFGLNLDVDDPAQPARLSASVHELGDDAILGIDEEGGLVTRLEPQGSSTPGSAILGRVDDVETTRRAHERIGSLVRAAGVDMSAAPDVDVNNNPANPVIGVRSFGADEALVSRHATAAVEGLQAHVAACAKHFPGHGDTSVDSHLGLPVVDLSLEELELHLAPFRAAVAAGVQVVMSAHIVVPALGERPCTLNPRAVELLRGMGFDGLLVSDALDMHAIAKGVGVGRGAVLAVQAGVDMLCLGYPRLGLLDPTKALVVGDEYASLAGADAVEPTGVGADPTGLVPAAEVQWLEAFEAVRAAVLAGEIPVSRLREAEARRRRVAAFARELRERGGEVVEFDGVAAARRGMGVVGDVRLAEGRVLMVDARTGNRAAGPAPDLVTLALRAAEYGASGSSRDGGSLVSSGDGGSVGSLSERSESKRVIDRLPVNDEASREAAVAAVKDAADVVVQVNQPQGSAAERETLAAILAVRPDAVVLRTGVVDGTSWSAREVHSFGMSGVGAQAVAEVLLGR